MHNIWFERSIPSQYEPMLAGAAVAIGAGDLAGENPLHQVAEADGIIAGGLTYDGVMMDQAPRVLVITRVGIGYDKVDIDAATVRGIAICNTPDAPTISTAEMAITLMMAVARNLKMVEADLRDALQNGSPRREYIAFELYGKRLGLVGLGRIGGHVAKIASAMGMHVAAYDPYLSAERAAELGVEVVNSLEELLGMSDVVSLHLPLSPETQHTMNAERFAQMKPNAILINAARGGHVDEKALLDALDSGKLFGAGLDVTDPEPPLKDNPLLYRENVVLTPHIASATFAGKEKMFTKAIEQVLQVLRGERPPHLLNPDVWPQVVERLNAR